LPGELNRRLRYLLKIQLLYWSKCPPVGNKRTYRPSA